MRRHQDASRDAHKFRNLSALSCVSVLPLSLSQPGRWFLVLHLRTRSLEVSRGELIIFIYLHKNNKHKVGFILCRIMQSNSSASSAPLTGLSVCEEEEREMLELDSPAGALSNLATYNLSLNCWLHILSKESSLDLHGDTANLAVGVPKDLLLSASKNCSVIQHKAMATSPKSHCIFMLYIFLNRCEFSLPWSTWWCVSWGL